MIYTHPTQIPRSKTLITLEWTGERICMSGSKIRGDSYPLTWADDGDLYAGTGDPSWGIVDGVIYNTYDFVENRIPKEHLESYITQHYGSAVEKIIDGPEDFKIERVNDLPAFIGWGGDGSKPSGMISVDGVLYHAVQNLLGYKVAPNGKSQHGSDATIISSRDHGKTWEPDLNGLLASFYGEYHTGEIAGWKIPAAERDHIGDWRPMFPGPLFGGPAFVQFGRDNADAVDDYVYAVSTEQWDNGSEMRLGRVLKDRVMDRSAWEFAGPSGDGVEWTPVFDECKPVLTIKEHLGLPEMIYLPKIKKYITSTWALHTFCYGIDGSELTVLESDNPWGPFSLVYYEWMWDKREICPYCPRIPLKWFDQETMSGYLLHSGQWMSYDDKPAPNYKPFVRPFKFIQA